MPRRWFGGASVIYLVGLFGFGLSRYFANFTPQLGDALAYGAGWPLIILRALGLI
ncbi:MAG: hypothetical protein ACE5DS_01605 [Kiloniellaceae bacterium]